MKLTFAARQRYCTIHTAHDNK